VPYYREGFDSSSYGTGMRRREFITLLGGAAAAWPVATYAQKSAVPVIGFLCAGSPEAFTAHLRAFRQGLRETGYVEGQNIAIEFRWAHDDFGRLPQMAAELVRHQVAVVVASPSPPAPLAAKAATASIPIVFGMGGDPVQVGLVASLNQPGGNVTGISVMNVDVAAKRFELLQELLPSATRFAALVNTDEPRADSMILELETTAASIGRRIEVSPVRTVGDIDNAFMRLVEKHTDALMVTPSSLFATHRVQLVTLAARHSIPTSYFTRAFVELGGLMSYGGSIVETYRLVGIYTARILRGEKPAGMPIIRSAAFEFVINQQTARALGITIPRKVLAFANELIE
jgi:putative ABC transport system substrate-binding protein